jgi:hypothetical protein
VSAPKTLERRSKSAIKAVRYLDLVSAAARELVKQGYLLEDDVATLVKRADGRWSHLFADGKTNRLAR